MTYGLHIINQYGAVQIDSNLPPMALVQSGTGVATGLGNDRLTNFYTATITYARNYLNPVVFIRASVGNEFSIFSQGASGFTYMSRGTIEYRIYECGPIWSVESEYGLRVWNAAGQLVFASDKLQPLLNQITQCWSPSPLTGLTSPGEFHKDTGWVSYSFTMVAFDGGLPFVSGQTFMDSLRIQGASGESRSTLQCKFSSSTSLEIASRYLSAFGSFSQLGKYWYTGQTVRQFLLIG